ncbi:MAG: dihydroorotate dehydrogenase [Bacillota bacterium]|nr:dihydroorotate dehydrogenase [Bacillota bacterium]
MLAKPDLTTAVAGLTLPNPIIPASGCAGYGREFARHFELRLLGGLAAKALSLEPRRGNPPPRVAEAASGMLNAVGLQNPGWDLWVRDELPWMLEQGVTLIQNIVGHQVDDYVELARRLDTTAVDVIEINLSCPNVADGMSFGAEPAGVETVTAAVRAVTSKPLWVKLTPQTASIAATAAAAARAGADAVSLINTIPAMVIDVESRRPVLRNNTGGLSGPAIRPVALRMVNEVYRSVAIPIVGIGGIETVEDVVAFLLAGASAVQIGTAALIHPTRPVDLVSDLADWCRDHGVARVSDLIGALELW